MVTPTLQAELKHLLHDYVMSAREGNTQKTQELGALIASEYGEIMHEILQDVYDEYAPDNDVEPLTNYLLTDYIISNLEAELPIYAFEGIKGIRIFVDEYEGQESRLALLPNPLQLVITIEDEAPIVVWEA